MKNHNRTFRLSFTMLMLIALSMLPFVSAGASPDPIIGKWTSVDTDGSNQKLAIGGGPGNTYHVFLYDDGASVCGLDAAGNILYAATARGIGLLNADVLQVDFQVYCLAMPAFYQGAYQSVFTYDAVADTLTDNNGVVWYRN